MEEKEIKLNKDKDKTAFVFRKTALYLIFFVFSLLPWFYISAPKNPGAYCQRIQSLKAISSLYNH